jgi:hypothetical protein
VVVLALLGKAAALDFGAGTVTLLHTALDREQVFRRTTEVVMRLARALLASGAFLILLQAPGSAQERPSYDDAQPLSLPSLDYPKSIFSSVIGPAKRGVGQRFASKDGRAVLSVYSLQNPEGDSPSSFIRKNMRTDLGRIEYQRVTSRFLALSTRSGGRIFYTRCNFGRTRAIHCFEVAYPEEEKKAWDAVVTRMSHSLASS